MLIPSGSQPPRLQKPTGRVRMKVLLASLLAVSTMTLGACATAEPVSARYVSNGYHDHAVIRVGPPPPRHEVIVAAPGPRDHWVWDPGHYRWINGQYDWVGGHWIEKPRPHAEWIAAKWVKRHGEWVLVDGHWR